MLQEARGDVASHPAYRRYHYAYGPLSVTDAAGTRFIGTDALGSPTDLTTTTGTVAAAHQYDAWGQYRNGTAPSAEEPKLGYTGHQYDPETGLVYARARYYDPEIGIFISRDTYEGELAKAPWLHRFAYARGNPLTFLDPTGRSWVCAPGEYSCMAEEGEQYLERQTACDQGDQGACTTIKQENYAVFGSAAAVALPFAVAAAPTAVVAVGSAGGGAVVTETAIDLVGVGVGAAGCAQGDQRSCLEMSASALDAASGPLNPTSELILADRAVRKRPPTPRAPAASSPSVDAQRSPETAPSSGSPRVAVEAVDAPSTAKVPAGTQATRNAPGVARPSVHRNSTTHTEPAARGATTGTARPRRVIGLGIDDDLPRHRTTGAITYENGAWQKAGLTTVDQAKAALNPSWFRRAFREAAKNADSVRFDVTSFDPKHPKPGMTSWEFAEIVNDPKLLAKTEFIKNGGLVKWDGKGFVEAQ